jgi:large subunit ribosomal protein L13
MPSRGAQAHKTTQSFARADVAKRWLVVDAEDQVLGRLATRVATILRGKHRPQYTPHADTGDFVIVVNAAKVTVSGDLREKKYWRHSMYPGGLKSITQEKLLATRPERVVEYAVKGMLPHNSLGAVLLRHLKVYAGPDHPHEAQVNAGKGKAKAAKE